MAGDKDQIIKVIGLPLGAGFNWSVGVLMEKFIKNLADKKLLGTKCKKCGEEFGWYDEENFCIRCNRCVKHCVCNEERE